MELKKTGFYFHWVCLNKLAIGPAPRKQDHFNILFESGIQSIFTLCDEKDTLIPESQKLRFSCKRITLPDHRSNRDPLVNELIEAINLLRVLTNKSIVYVHCLAAIERSPLICIAWLVLEQQLSFQEALEYMKEVHPETNPLPSYFHVMNKAVKYIKLNNPIC